MMERAARCLAGLLETCMVIACMMPIASSLRAADLPPVVRITHGYFVATPDSKPPPDAAAWVRVALPDSWPSTRPDFLGNGWYRFHLDLPALPPKGAGMYISSVRTQTELYVNGQYAGASGIIDGTSPDRIGFSQLFVVPTQYLQTGPNRFHLRVYRPGSGGGIGEIEFGNYRALYVEWLSRFIYNFASYSLVGVTITTIGLFILVLWVQRRTQTEYFYFGAGALTWGLHSLFRLLPGQMFPLHYTVWWHFSSLLSVALLTIFCIRFAQRKWTWFERLVWGCAIALLPVFYATAAIGPAFLGVLPQTTEVMHMLFNVFIIVALVAVVQRVREDHSFESWLLLLGALSFSAPRFIAWIGANDRTLDMFTLTPAAILAFVVIAGWILLDRFVRTASDLEKLNAQLELRVAEKAQELRAQLSVTETAREEAEKANLAKSRFLAAASHDLRQPLHALGLFAAALDESTHDAKERDLVGHINQSISALDTLFNGVLDVSKLDAGAVAPSIRNVALQRIFDRIGDELWPHAEAKLLRLQLRRTSLVVRTDPVLIERILRNLVHNAIRYTLDGGVIVAARRRGAAVNLEVWDTGIGIAPEHQSRIFEEFYQVGNTERDRSQGLGLGLAIVKRLSELLEHPLELHSRPGRGSLFRLVLPVAESDADADQLDASHVADVSRDVLDGKCITVIDDEPSVREGMVALLASWRCQTLVAGDESEAVSVLDAARRMPDLLIVDYRLHDRVIGIDVVNALRRRYGEDIPAIIISGESSAIELARITESGLPMLHKPVTPAKLRSMIWYLLSNVDALT